MIVLGYHNLGQKKMNDLIRTDTVFGKRVNIVGNISADLVLESLGKIYIKSRNKSQTLEEVIKSLAIEDPNISTSKVKVIEGLEGLDTNEFKEGTFVFDKLSNILYLFIDNELLELINVAPEGTGYVKRSGDTMTGKLSIYVKSGPPLYVNSSTLIENLNAQYLNGETAESFTRRNKNEKINGAWTFRNNTTFESPALFYKDVITHGSIGTPEFSSGFGGYGWRLDADTNTLTIDNLIVRKLMHVYELVVNKISATNGSLWVTNAGKVSSVQKLEIKENSFFSDSPEYNKFCANRHQNQFFIRLFSPIEYKSFSDPVAAFSTASGSNIFIKRCWSTETLRNAKVVKTLLDTNYTGQYFNETDAENYRIYNLFSNEFIIDCTFPIITRNDYTRYIQDRETGIVDISSYVSIIYSYFKYFAGGDFYLVTFDGEELPVFKPGDILRCQKWTYDGIKYYDAVICNIIGKSYIIQLAKSIFDKTTTITYDSSLTPQVTYEYDDLNLGLYEQSSYYKEPSQDPNENVNYDEDGNATKLSYQEQQEKDLIGIVEEKDSLVQIGNLWNPQRQNAVYITSTDNGAPFMDVISGVNRPDYSVIYYVPTYQTAKLHTTASVNKDTFIGFTNLVDIPYTGDYYIQKDKTKCEYVYFKYNDVYYLALGSTVPSIPGGSVDIIYYLSTIPNENTKFSASSEYFPFITEDGEVIITEGFENGTTVEEKYIVLEKEQPLLQVASTRTTKVRLGNLDGIRDEIFPMDKQPYGYGLYGQNVFLTGEFYLNNGRSLADIGNDAITFAVAVQNSFYNALDVLKEDLQKADDLLSQSVYSKGELRSAGMRIAKNNILLWGNHIIIATTENEFKGIEEPTALFSKGKIDAKFIQVHNIHSALGFGTSIPIIQKQYEYNGQKYYKEEQVYTEVVTEDGVAVTKYYYVNSLTGANVYLDNLPSTYGNTIYGWNLEATGEGYLAKNNISWDQSGKLTVKGDIIINESNGIHIFNTYGYNTLNVTGRSVDTLTNWAESDANTFYLQSSYNNLDTISVTQIYDIDGNIWRTYDPDYPSNLGIIKTLTLDQSDITVRFTASYQYLLNTEARPPAEPSPLILILYFKDNTSKAYKIGTEQVLQFEVGSNTLTEAKVCIEGDGCQYASGSFTYQAINLSSEIGANFMGMYSGNTMFWFGSQGFRVGSMLGTTTRYSHCGLSVDNKGVFVVKPYSTISNVVDLAEFLDMKEKWGLGVDLLYGIDGTFDCQYYSDEEYITDGNYYLGHDANAPNEGKFIIPQIGESLLLDVIPQIGGSKVHIIRPSTQYNMKVTIKPNGGNIRIGQILIILLDIGESNNNFQAVRVEAYNGRIYVYDSNSLGDAFVSYTNDPSYGIPLSNKPLILMYMGQKRLDNENFHIWKSLTLNYLL